MLPFWRHLYGPTEVYLGNFISTLKLPRLHTIDNDSQPISTMADFTVGELCDGGTWKTSLAEIVRLTRKDS